MASSFLRGIAIAAGTGLAVGAGYAFGRRPSKQRDIPANLEPFLARLDRLEARVALAESRPAAAAEPAADAESMRAAIARIDECLTAQAREIEMLRIRADEAEKIAAAEIRLTERRFKEATEALPGEIEAIVAPRVTDLRQRLHVELEESVEVALAGFEQSIDARVSSRITAIEQQLAEQSASLADLRTRATQADQNLQKLIGAVERLCDQRDAELKQQTVMLPVPEPAATPEPAFLDLPFDKELRQALAATPANVAGISDAGTLRPHPIPEDEPVRPRFPIARVIFAAAATLLGAKLRR